jgi:hypothetical protein
MDARIVTINEVLCFVRSRYGRLPDKLLKQTLYEYYDANVLLLAKNRLLEDIGNLKMDKEHPRTAEHRDGPNRAKLEVDDIFALFSFMDVNMVLDNLPIYVVEDIDRIPTSKWLDGDLQLILAKMNNIVQENGELKRTLNQIICMLVSLNDRSDKIDGSIHILASESNTRINAELSSKLHDIECSTNAIGERMDMYASFSDVLRVKVTDDLTAMTNRIGNLENYVRETNVNIPRPGNTSAVNVASGQNSGASNLNIVDRAVVSEDQTTRLGQVWAEAESDGGGHSRGGGVTSYEDFSTDGLARRYLVTAADAAMDIVDSAPTDADAEGGTTSDGGEPFVEPPRRKRHRSRSQQQTADSAATAVKTAAGGVRALYRLGPYATVAATHTPTPTQTSNRQNSSHQSVIGKKLTTAGCRIKASAVPVPKKAVFAVSNLSDDCTDTDITSYLADQGISVVTCFPAKTRFPGRKAFRVCLLAKDAARFLSADIWPENVTLREWHFKDKSN